MLFDIPAIKGVEFGLGFEVSKMRGSENNDSYTIEEGEIETLTNNAGGVLGGLILWNASDYQSSCEAYSFNFEETKNCRPFNNAGNNASA